MAFKEYDFELTETAESDIDATYEYIAETLGNPDAASGFNATRKKYIFV